MKRLHVGPSYIFENWYVWVGMNDRFGKRMKMVGWRWKQREVTVVEDDEQLEADSFCRDAQ